MSFSDGPSQSGYGDQERVFVSPAGGYDAARVAAAARAQDPGLPEEMACELATYAGEHLRHLDPLDAPELARRLMADYPAAGATPAAVVAKAAVDFCTEQNVRP